MFKQPMDLLQQLWRTHRGMTLFFMASLLWLVVALVGMAVDSRVVLGQSTWTKSMKFAISFVAYAPTLIWLSTFVTRGRRWFNLALNGVAVTLGIELVITSIQAVRGEAMHFNVSTPLNTMLWAAMGIIIMIFFGITIVGFGVILRQKLADQALTHSIRWGFAIMLLGLTLGFLMTGPTPEQATVLAAGGVTTAIGAHTVGVPDGGPGLPVTGWSTEHGDLRIGHFVGLHGLQVIPLIGWWLYSRGKRGRSRLSAGQRVQIVWTSALAYTALVLLVTWQALRGEALLRPDALTLGVLVTILAVTGLSLATVAGRASGHSTATLGIVSQ